MMHEADPPPRTPQADDILVRVTMTAANFAALRRGLSGHWTHMRLVESPNSPYPDTYALRVEGYGPNPAPRPVDEREIGELSG